MQSDESNTSLTTAGTENGEAPPVFWESETPSLSPQTAYQQRQQQQKKKQPQEDLKNKDRSSRWYFYFKFSSFLPG